MSKIKTQKPSKPRQKRFNIKISKNVNHNHDDAKKWLQENVGPTWKDGDLTWTVRAPYYNYITKKFKNHGMFIYSFRDEKDAVMFALRWAR